MYHRIFVAIDNSSTAQKALAEAIALAGALQAALCVAYVADETALTQYGMGLGSYIDIDRVKTEIAAGGEALLDQAMALAAQAGCRAERQLIAASGRRVAELINEAAQAWDADLLVIGAHGDRGFERFLVGSVAENLTRICAIGLLIVRKP